MNIFPSFACNFQCKFCHISKMDKGELLDLDWLESNLKDMPVPKKIGILGGEPSILPDEYLSRLISLCYQKNGKAPQMYTNLYKISPFINDVELMVSYDPGSRQARRQVFQNMLLLQKPFTVSTIVTKAVVEAGVDKLLQMVRRVKNIKQIHLSSYAAFSDCEDLRPTPEELATFCEEFIRKNDGTLRFSPINAWISGEPKRTSLMGSIEIMPNGSFVIAPRENEPLHVFKTFQEAAGYYEQEYSDTLRGCEGCPYDGKCTHMYKDKPGDPDRIIMEHIGRVLS